MINHNIYRAFLGCLAGYICLCCVSVFAVPPIMTESETLLASNGKTNDSFGNDIEFDGGVLLIGAREDDQFGVNSGSVYVFRQQPDDTWIEAYNITPQGSQPSELFGTTIVYHNNIAFISNVGGFIGEPRTVYVFRQDAPDQWTEIQRLNSNDSHPGDGFGWSIAQSGDLLAIGSPIRDDQGNNSGAAYIFRRNIQGQWIQEAKLLPKDGNAEDQFGNAVTFIGPLCIVGAYAVSDFSPINHGAVYVFEEQSPGNWVQRAKLVDPNGETGDRFGASLAACGDTLAIGAPRDVVNQVLDAGSVHVFHQLSPSLWQLEQKITRLIPNTGEQLGVRLALEEDSLFISATNSNVSGVSSGAVYLYERQPLDVWEHR